MSIRKFDDERAIEDQGLTDFIANARRVQDQADRYLSEGRVLTINHARSLINTSRQNFSKAIATGALETFRMGGRVYTTMMWLVAWRNSLAFHRKGQGFADANLDDGNAAG